MDRYADLLDGLEQLIWQVNEAGEVDYLNQRWYQYTGQPQNTAPFANSLLEHWIHPDDYTQSQAVWQQVQTTGKSASLEARLRGADGQFRWFMCRVVPRRKNGQLVGWSVSCSDLDEQRENQRRQQFLFENSPNGVVYQDAQGQIVAANQAAQQILGLSLEQLQGRTSMDPRWRTLRPDGSPFPGNEHPAMLTLQQGKPTEATMGVFHPAKEQVRWLRVRAVPRFTGEKVNEVFAIFEDITEVLAAEEALRQSEAQSREILESIADAFFALDRNWCFTYINREAEELLGRSAQSLLGQNVWHEFPDAAGSIFEEQYTQAMNGQAVFFEAFYGPLNRWFDIRAYPKADGVSIYFHDVSARHKAEAALRQSEERYRTLFESIEQGVCVFEMIYDRSGQAVDYRFLEVNANFERHTGLANAEGHTAKELVPGLEDTWIQTYDRVAQTGEALRFEQGSEAMGRWFEVNAVRVGGADSRRVALFFSDVSERKQAEAALQESERRFRGIFNATFQYTGLLTPDGTVLEINKTALEAAGVEAASVMGQTYWQTPWWNHYPQERQRVKAAVEQAAAGEFVRFEARYARAGKEAVVDFSISPVFNQSGEVVLLVTEGRDITERKHAELALAQSEERYRLLSEAQKRFVADASHELRAPLTSIQGNLELLQRFKNMAPQDRQEAIDEAAKEAARLGRLVGDLLSLARGDAGLQLQMEPVTLDTLLRESLSEVRHRSSGHLLEVGELPPTVVWGHRDRLKQLAVIFVDNALKYTPAGGQIRLELRHQGGQAELQVSDSGIGIAPEDLPHVFERFYRAEKSRNQESGGSGLGLSIAQWIVEQHGGSIEMESALGVGTTVTVRLPLAPHQTSS